MQHSLDYKSKLFQIWNFIIQKLQSMTLTVIYLPQPQSVTNLQMSCADIVASKNKKMLKLMKKKCNPAFCKIV